MHIQKPLYLKKIEIIHSEKIFETREAFVEHKESFLHFECKPCNVAYLTNKELRAHNDKPDCRAYICSHCGVNFQTSDPRRKASRNRFFHFNFFPRFSIKSRNFSYVI